MLRMSASCVGHIHTRWCPSSLAKLVQITPISLWFMADITTVNGGYLNQRSHHWGAPSCIKILAKLTVDLA